MRERPFQVETPAIPAILRGVKHQLRRFVNPQPRHRLIDGIAGLTIGMNPADDGHLWYDADCINPGVEVRCPFGRIFDRLWVQEEWNRDGGVLSYKADGDWISDSEYLSDAPNHPYRPRWMPASKMQRDDSRILVEITDVKTEEVARMVYVWVMQFELVELAVTA